MIRLRAWFVVISLSVLVPHSVWAASFGGIGFLPDDNFSSGPAISGDGLTIAAISGNTKTGVSQGFRLTAGIKTPLPTLDNSSFFEPLSVSSDGSAIAGHTNGGPAPHPHEAATWTNASGTQGLGFLSGTDGTGYSFAARISGDGAVAAGFNYVTTTVPGKNEAFRWAVADGMQGLGFLPGGTSSGAYNISANGSTIVGAGSTGVPDEVQAFRWSATDGLQGLGYLPGGNYSLAMAASEDGSVITGYASNGLQNEAFRWTKADGLVPLGLFPGTGAGTYPSAMSADGSIIVGRTDPNNPVTTPAFIWDAVHGMRDLRQVLISDYGLGASLTGWTLGGANGISANGNRIVGFGINPSGQQEAWVAVIPEPSGAVIATIGCLVLVVAARVRRS